MELFALDSSSYWKWRNSSTSNWKPSNSTFKNLAGAAAPFEQSMAAVARGSVDVDIFVIGTHSDLWHTYHEIDSAWDAAWENLGGVLTTGPAAVSWSPERIDVFALGDAPAFELFQMTWTYPNGWKSWYGIGGRWETFTPTPVTWGPNRLHVFVVDPDTSSLHHVWWEGSDWQFEDLGGYCTSRPTAVSRNAGTLDVIVRGGDAGLWHLSYQQSSWGEWQSLDSGTSIQSEPEAITCASSNVELFAWSDDGTLLHKSGSVLDGDITWAPSKGYEVVGNGLAGPPKSVCDGEQSVDVFAYLDNGQVGQRTWDRALKTWSPSDGFELLGSV